MKILRLYIENFMCHESSYIDFSQFNSALILGKVDNNDLYSNGVGKTTIFKAIEYGFFNQADVNLEKIIRDDAASCKITIDFTSEEKEYRLVRTRTKKGTTDISLFERTSIDLESNDLIHKKNKDYDGIYIPIIEEKYWKDISGRRAIDTEKDLNKLLKINFKSFRGTVHFVQNDFSGLTTATPEKRKGILKEALNLAIYSKLEKIAKDKSNLLYKDIEKHQTLIENLKDPAKDLESLSGQLSDIDLQIINKSEILKDKLSELNSYNNNLNKLKEENSLLENKFSGLIITNNNLNTEKKNIEKSIKEYTDKKSNIIKFANEVIADLKKLKESKEKLSEINYDQINSLNEIVNGKKESLTKNNVIIQNNISKIEELKIPLPLDAECRHCRQVLSDEHKINCQLQIDKELKDCQLHIGLLKKENVLLNSELLEAQKDINYLNNSKKELDKIIDSISFKEQELKDKKALHKEYLDLLSKFENDLKEVEEKIKLNLIDLQSSSQEESNKIKQLIEKQSVDIDNLNKEIALINKELSHNNSLKAVLAHNIEQKEKEKIKKEELKKSLEELNNKYTVYPNVLQAFSSTGIPNLIIQNVLDDLQVEANNLLIQLNPALQLNFATEKTKTDGSEAETLDINYFLNGKERQYDQLSGAQKLSVTFSLKLGLSFLLQKMIGTNIKFLLLDEIDQALDKASVDAFANIVKHFQKDFTILVITHNDRLKDKFKHSVLVEQDINMISRARVFNSY